MSRRQGARALVVMGIMLAAASLAAGQEIGSAPGPRFVLAGSPASHRDASGAPVLRRRVTLELSEVPLDRALKAIVEQADLEITYSSRVIPLDRRVSLHAAGTTVGAAMAQLLAGLPVDVSVTDAGGLALVRRRLRAGEPADSGVLVGRVTDSTSGAPIAGASVVLVGTTRGATTDAGGRYRIDGLAAATYTVQARYIGYRPSTVSVTMAGGETRVELALTRSAQHLEQVVVTGTIVPTEVKALPTPITIVTNEDLERQGLQRIDQVYRGFVPSGVAWERGQNDYSSVIGVRGTTSLATTPTIKTYIDGIEVADPVMLATIDPASVERVEIARGPQASTLYGSGASGGVMQVFTKRGAFAARPQLSLGAAVGVMEGQFVDGTPLRQEYSATISGGGEDFRYNAGGTYRNVGEWSPTYYSHSPSFFAGGEWTQGRLTLAISARQVSKSFSWIDSPLLSDLRFFSRPSYRVADLDQQTYGVTASHRTTAHWTHELVLGEDRSDFAYHTSRARLTTPADTFLEVAAQQVARASIRYHTAYEWRLGPGIGGTVTGGAEYADAMSMSSFTFNATRASSSLDGTTFANRDPVDNAGYFGQVQVNIKDALFLTGGVRAEQNSNFGDSYGTAWSPRIGASYFHPLGSVSIKLRASYGSALRAPSAGFKGAYRDPFFNQVANPDLGPERQHGWDAGAELSVGTRLFLAGTYYAQIADDLIDQVTLDPSVTPAVTQFQNIGRIRNAGWELEARVELSRLRLQASYSVPRSTVRRLSPTYLGDLRLGDPLLGIPRSISGVTATYSASPATHLMVGLSRFGSWIGTDYLTLYQFYYGGAPYRGSGRDYWIEYPSVTKVRLSLAQRLTAALTGHLQVENVGNNRRYEDNNLNLPVGRVVEVGIRAEL
jgi:outer membrane receptor protein involved in Fe transport